METPENERAHLPNWLRRVQENSWEPEILLSGLVLIGLLQLPGRIDEASRFIMGELLGQNMAFLFVILKQVVYILIAGLIIHLFLRSVWVGFIGLSYAFPEGIRKEKLRYREQYQREIEKLPDTESLILRLEKICSAIFATCFFLIMLLLGVGIALLSFGIVLWSTNWLITSIFDSSVLRVFDRVIDPFLLFITVLVAIDFVGIGLYRKNRILGKLFYPLYKFIGWITFSRLYRPIYYLFATNIHRGYLSLFLVVFFFISLFGQLIFQRPPDKSLFSQVTFYERGFEASSFFSPYYADRNEAWTSQIMEIPGPIVKGRFLEVSIRHQIIEERFMFELCGLDEESLDEKPNASELRLQCANQYYRLHLDGQLIENPDWMYYFHQKDRRKGFITFLDVSALTPGRHTLELFDGMNDVNALGKLVFLKE